ncbi:hypothetical protein PXC01_05765 [Maribacter sp. M208]|uniref:hypothetical protein n=1 Tax=Maribacter huludaoensis TaxID=3030010 RepID=UPI0023EB0561|nr:hypothetical protein [Maribacter huludaoensis]MDF4221086.1 hypothetical protein [Maribacter huludaoensis]
MENIFYNILWIDDEHQTLGGTKGRAKRHGINLFPFKSLNGGMSELERNYTFYDGVLLDAKYFENEDDAKGSEDTYNIHRTKERLLQLKKKFEVFVLTGQAEAYEDKTFKKAFTKVYKKGSDEEINRLFKDIKKAVEDQEITQLKHKHLNAFLLCDDNYLGRKEFERILQLIKDVEKPENITNQQDALSPMRKILEAIFKKLNTIGLIPDEIQNGRGSINGASLFLAGYNKGYTYNEELIHPVIAESIRHLISLTQDASHNEGNKLRADTYLTNTSNTYLYRSLCYSLLEVLDNLKPFIDENLDKSKNQSKWQLVQATAIESGHWITGKITKVADNGYGTFQPTNGDSTLSILPNKIEEYLLNEGDALEITTKPSACGTKTFIDEIKKVDL